jgi:Domain of unknown function (DUF4185)
MEANLITWVVRSAPFRHLCESTARGRSMSMSRTLAAILIAMVEALAINANAATLSLVGASTKVCQLVGETDWATNQPTAAKTATNFGLDAVDLGFPVDSSPGPLYFLFGDARPEALPPDSIPSAPPDDAVGFTTRTAVPNASTCLDLQLATSVPKTFAHPTVQPSIQQGLFNVPTGGVFLDNTFYAFFWTDHCVFPTGLAPDPITPLRRPPPSATCPEIPESSSVGRSVLAAAAPANPVGFHWTPPLGGLLFRNMPRGFVYASAAMPPLLQSKIPVFGAPRYRASIPFLAVAPRATFADADTWSFFAGRVAGHPTWVTLQEWENGHNAAGEWVPPPSAEIYEGEPAEERCVGEHSVTWNAPLRIWLLLYSCTPLTVEARFAPEPWGPWSPPTILISVVQSPGVVCTLIQSAAGCPGLQNYQTLPNGAPWPGAFYAPFVMDRFTQDATPPGPGQPKRATIYWLLSTWNPYVVVVMQSTLELQ